MSKKDDFDKIWEAFGKLRKVRGGKYGPFDSHQAATALVWKSLVAHYMACNPGRPTLEVWMVPGFFAADKLVRAFAGKAYRDNAVDGAHYLFQMIRMQEKNLGKRRNG